MHAVAPAARPSDRTPRPEAPARRQTLPEADERDGRGLLYDAPADRLGAPVQRRAVVGRPDDPLEREADRAADRVVRGEPVQPLSRLGEGTVRRCTDCGGPEDDVLRRQPIEDEDEEPIQLVQRQPTEEEEDEIQLRRNGDGPTPTATEAASRAVRSPGAGAPLRSEPRARLEAGFGVDLGDVRVHEDAAAHRSADALRAQAFAHDRHIWLGRGASQADLHLMAHETAHVLQQDGVVRRRLADAPAPEAEPPPPRVEPDEETVEAATDVAEAATEAALPPAEPPAGEGEPGGDGTDVEILMPEPPASMSDDERARLGAVDRRAGEAASEQEALPPADSQTAEARGAVTEPQEEANARAEAALVAALGEQPAPSPEVEALCDRIRSVIESRRPPDEEALVRADPEAVAADAGRQLDTQLEGQVETVEGEYDGLEQPQQGTPEQTGDPLQPPPESVETTSPRATTANPEGVGPEAVDLGPDVEASQARREESGMTGDVADEITDPSNPVVQAREAQGELEETAATAPEAVLAEQTELLAASEADMAALQERALAALTSSRAETVRAASGQQGDMVGAEEQTRESVAREAQAIYDDAQGRVRELLQPLQQTAMDRWERGVEVLATRFRQSLNRVEAWIEERHEGAWGSVVSVWDDLAGLPDWITREYDRAERAFGDGVCALLREISTEVNGVVMACERIIADARTDIDALFDSLPEDLREWAETERETFQGRLDGLSDEVQDARQSLTDDLTERAAQSVDEVRREVHELRQAARGLVGQLADAVDAFLDDPARFIIEGLLTLVGIEPAAFWAVVARIQSVVQDIADDPLGFAENLLLAVGQGFQRFFDNIGDHLLGGLLDWLFSGLGSVGVEVPTDFSLKSVITFFLQVMGITWDRIRTILARHIGEENVALLERAYEIVSSLIEMGPEGVFEMIKEQLDPQRILSMVLEAAIDFLVEALITQVTARVLMLFNPVGAVAQAIEAIYRVLKWIFENAARIFSLVETVVNGVADILAGNVAGMAEAVEGSLARLVAPVIDFFAGYVGLGDLPEKIADVIRRMQDWVEGILDRVIGFIAGQARRLLAALGIGGEEESDDLDTDHASLAARAKEEMEAVDSEPESYSDLRQDRETVAQDVERRYTALLEDGIALTVVFAERSQDEGDQDVDFTIRIAPNTTEVAGAATGVELPETRVAPAPQGGRAGSVEAKPLTKKPGNTTGSSSTNAPVLGWSRAVALNSISQNWVRAHLLHFSLHGPTEVWNLTPASIAANNKMARDIEGPAITRVSDPDPEILYYRTRIEYWPSPDDDFARTIYVSYGTYDPASGQETAIETDYPISSIQPAGGRAVGNLSADGRVRLAEIGGFDDDLARAITRARAVGGEFQTRADLRDRLGAEGIGPDEVEDVVMLVRYDVLRLR